MIDTPHIPRTILMTPGETTIDEWNAVREPDDPNRVVQGYANYPLTEKGQAEVNVRIRQITEGIGEIHIVCHGHQLAATQTADVVGDTLANQKGGLELKKVNCLDFRSFGDFNTMKQSDIWASPNERFQTPPERNFERDPRITPPNGEIMHSIDRRAKTVIEGICKAHEDKTKLIICDASMLLILQSMIGKIEDLDVLLTKIQPVAGVPTAYVTPMPEGSEPI